VICHELVKQLLAAFRRSTGDVPGHTCGVQLILPLLGCLAQLDEVPSELRNYLGQLAFRWPGLDRLFTFLLSPHFHSLTSMSLNRINNC
jgi:hypothetical protein